MILLLSLILDGILFIRETVRGGKMEEGHSMGTRHVSLRFPAMSALINSYAYYMILGLTDTFGAHLLIALVCTAAAKIFVVWVYLCPEEPEGEKRSVYLLAVLLSLCPHASPLAGLFGTTFLLLFLLYTENRGKAQEGETVSEPQGESSLYLKTIEDSYRKNRALMHDLNNHIIAIRSLAEERKYEKLLDYTDSMAEKVSESLFPVHSGNTVLDALLADKYHTAQRNGIFVEFRCVRYEAGPDSGDLCTVIGNLLDNAIAENLKTSKTEERRISIDIHGTEEELTVRIKNPLFHPLKIRNGLPVSDKPDVEHHGIGLKNVRRVCEAYRGTLVWDDADGEFSVTAQLKMIRNP